MADIPPEGPFSQENWRRALANQPSRGGFEYPLHTDARIVGEASFGPYRLLNAVPIEDRFGRIRPTLYLQVEDHGPDEIWPPDMSRTETARFHGGLLEDERGTGPPSPGKR